MWTFPVLLDCRPALLQRKRAGSLLLAPLGDSTVLSHLRSRLRNVTEAAPLIVTRFEIDGAYEQAVRKACPEAEAVETLPAFVDQLHAYEPSDQLLLADPTCFPLDAQDPALGRVADGDDLRSVTHLVALDQRGEGTKEYLDTDSSGRIRAIQRYYDSVTWPFAAGVAWSLVPVACLRVAYGLPLTSLSRLRRVLASEGVPSRDVALERGAVNLATAGGLLAMNERVVLALARQSTGRQGRRSSLLTRSAAHVHASASIVGPVVLQDGVEVGEGATIIGPSVIGTGSRVEARATVAQCVVGPHQVVASGASLRHRVFLADSEGEATAIETAVAGEGKETAEYEGLEAWEPAKPGFSVDGPRPSFYSALKRAMDAGAAAVGLLAGTPLVLLIAALIKLESRGPIHFGHVREGRGGRPFRCWKFRTMVLGAEQQQRKLSRMNEVDGPQFKVDRDPRRTRVGRFLTATNLDELPQLWNVLLGEMSLVGPRPSPFRENQVCVPWREGRLSVRPGITGLWQICRHDRHKGDFHQWIYYDLLYVRNMSLWLDLKILALTLPSLVWGSHVPLSWVLPPEKYGERRSAPRPTETEAPPRPFRG